MNGTVTVLDKGEVRIHSYMAPEKSVNVTSQIIETPERLIVVDGQFLGPFADEAAEYARSLGKPIDRLVITHGHPDHYAAAARWGAPLVSLPEVRDAILARGDVHLPTGGVVPVADVTPDGSVRVGEEVVDGVLLTFEHVVGGEAHDQLLIALPDHGVLIAQDLVYHDVHLYFGERDIDGWQRAVSLLAQAEGYDTVLAGHGLPTTPAVFGELERYLADAAELLGDDGAAYKAAITKRYPEYGGQFVIDIANRSLFPGAAG